MRALGVGFRAIDDAGDVFTFYSEAIIEVWSAPLIELQTKNPADVSQRRIDRRIRAIRGNMLC